MGQQLKKPAHWQEIGSMFNVGNEDEVFDYLSQKPHLIASLFEISNAIKEYFPDKGSPKLDLVKDPDIKDFEKLFIYIPYEGNIKKVYLIFRKFKREWFLKHCGNIIRQINVDLDFL